MASIDQADKSPSSGKFSETELISPSIMRLQWYVDVENLEVCRDMHNELPVKLAQREVLSDVSAVFDPPGSVSPFTI